MKTAIQELRNDILIEIKLGYISEHSACRIFNYIDALYLEKEKEQIQKAFSDGQETPINHPTLPHYSREEYYNDNYNQKELIILDFDKVQKEWIEEAKGMPDLEKVKYYLKKIQENENR